MSDLEHTGRCLCGAVRFTATLPSLFCAHCHCSMCRRNHGAGYVTWFGVSPERLAVLRGEDVLVHHASSEHGSRSFCGRCGSALWVWDPSWPGLIHPFASAIDTPLPKAPERVHLMLGSAASWVPVPHGKRESHFDEYPADSIEDWHKARGLYETGAP